MVKGNVAVAVHVRPLRANEHGCTLVVGGDGGGAEGTVGAPERDGTGGGGAEHLWVKGYERSFGFDHCIVSQVRPQSETAGKTPQELVYEKVGAPLTAHSLQGFNTCILAYGQTGSGKTYTMLGCGTEASGEAGIIPRVCQDLFSQIAAGAGAPHVTSTTVEVSFFEIYNEKVTCLLGDASLGDEAASPAAAAPPPHHRLSTGGGHAAGSGYLKVREHPITGPYVEALTQVKVTSYEQVAPLIQKGMSSRTVAETKYNLRSSRSHAVFALTITRVEAGNDGEERRVSKMNLVDLAGSEKISSSHKDATTKDGIQINKSLSALGRVIQSLADLSTAAAKRASGGGAHLRSGSTSGVNHVAYRDSVLTWLLKENLGGNSRTTMIACVSASDRHFEETLNTLRYADNVKKIRNCPRRARPQGALTPAPAAHQGLSAAGEGALATPSCAAARVGAYPLLVSLDPHMTAGEVLTWELIPGDTQVTTALPARDSDDDDDDAAAAPEVRYVALGEDAANVCDPHCLIATALQADGSFQVTLTPALGTVTFVDGALLTTPVVLQHANRVIFGSAHCFYFLDPGCTARLRRERGEQPAGARIPRVLDWAYAADEFAEVMQCNKPFEEVVKLQDEVDYWRGINEGEFEATAAAVRGCCLILASEPQYFPASARQPKAGLVFPLMEGRNRVSAEAWGLRDLCDGHHFYLEVHRGQVYKARKQPDDPLEPVYHGMKIAVKNSQFIVNCPLAPIDHDDVEAYEGYEDEHGEAADPPCLAFRDEGLEDLVHHTMGLQYQLLAMHDALYTLPLEMVDGLKDGDEDDADSPHNMLAPYLAADPGLQAILDYKQKLKDFALLETPHKDLTPHQVNAFLESLALSLRTLTHQFCTRLEAPPPPPFESRVTCEDLLEDAAAWRKRAEKAEFECSRLRLQMGEGVADAAAASAEEARVLRVEVATLAAQLRDAETEVDRLVAEAVLMGNDGGSGGDGGGGGFSLLPDPEEDVRKFELQQRVAGLEAEADELKAELKRQRKEHAAELAAAVATMQGERVPLKEIPQIVAPPAATKRDAEAAPNHDALAAKVAALEDEVRASKRRQGDLEDDLAAAAARAQAAAAAAAGEQAAAREAHEADLEVLAAQVAEAERGCAAARAQHADLEGEVAALQAGADAQAGALREAEAVLAQQREEASAELQAALRRVRDVETQRVSLRDEVLNLEGLLRRAEKERDALAEAAAATTTPRSPPASPAPTAASAAASDRLAELTEAQRALKKENKKLKQHVLEQKLVNRTLTEQLQLQQPAPPRLAVVSNTKAAAAPPAPVTPSMKAVKRSESNGSRTSRRSSGGAGTQGTKSPRARGSIARPPPRAHSAGRDARPPLTYVPHSGMLSSLELPRRASSRGKLPRRDEAAGPPYTAATKRTSSQGSRASGAGRDAALPTPRSQSNGGGRKSGSPAPRSSTRLLTTTHLRDLSRDRLGAGSSPRRALAAMILQRH